MLQNEPVLLTVKETARLFRVTRKTLERWEAAGILAPTRVGGIVRYRSQDIDALLRLQESA
jgi:excisionase family DNA binding protein